MVGVPTDRAWRHDYRNAIKNPEFRIRTELEPENWFSRFALLWLNQGTYSPEASFNGIAEGHEMAILLD